MIPMVLFNLQKKNDLSTTRSDNYYVNNKTSWASGTRRLNDNDDSGFLDKLGSTTLRYIKVK